MTWLVWNIKWINKQYKQKELTYYIHKNHAKLVGLLDTRVKKFKIKVYYLMNYLKNVTITLELIGKLGWLEYVVDWIELLGTVYGCSTGILSGGNDKHVIL
ncbi:hypothetical protein H5410_047582 [Solanum commersonii]|uniref:Uncharacterized protein n=1 Tax=Solanum commersonii TaxID=4109 RepID=A0A9J5XIP9_SOLCO|nr:hypothetical protein H5410_047582 [Solanum commersonii]